MTQCEYNIWPNVENLISLSHSDSFFGPVGRSLRMMLFSNIPLFLLHQIVWHYLKKADTGTCGLHLILLIRPTVLLK